MPNSNTSTASTLSDILQAATVRAHELEGALQTVPGKIVEYEQMLDGIALGYISMASEKVDIMALRGYLEASEVYQKLKDQDISPLLDFSLPNDTANAVLWVENKIKALEQFLEPLGLPEYGEYINMVLDIIGHLIQDVENAQGETVTEVYHDIKEGNIGDDLHRLADLTNTKLPELPELPKNIETIINDLEWAIDLMEYGFDPDILSKLLGNLVWRFLPADSPYTEEQITEALNRIFTEVAKIDFSLPTELVVRAVVQRLAELSATYATDHPSFAKTDKVIQVLSSIICFVIDHNLLDIIKIKTVKADESLIPGKPEKGKLPKYKPEKTTPSAHNTVVVYADGDDTFLSTQQIMDYLEEQVMINLPSDMRDFAERLLEGHAFAELEDAFSGFMLYIEDAATDAWHDLELFFAADPPITLRSLADTIFEHLEKLVAAIFKGIGDLVKKIIAMFSQLAQFAVHLILAIRVPTYPFIYVPGLVSLSNINIPCYLVALPWETFRHIHHPENNEAELSLI
ncbi:MAG TPA: hypothetical protein PKA00_19035 [Saprospiraceae bacterium]|nr:hypothetical protein [Saprospiraceae bacterium]HMQ85014.1 hypothetical protein [Saprospiraceae bacterium]